MSESQVVSWDLHELEDDIKSVNNGNDVLCDNGIILGGHAECNIVGGGEARVDNDQSHNDSIPDHDKATVRLDQEVRLAGLLSTTLLCFGVLSVLIMLLLMFGLLVQLN